MIMPPTQDPAGGRKYKSRWDTFLLRSFYATGARPAPSGPGWIVRRVSCLWHSPHREPHLTSAVCEKWGAEWPMTSVSHFSILYLRLEAGLATLVRTCHVIKVLTQNLLDFLQCWILMQISIQAASQCSCENKWPRKIPTNATGELYFPNHACRGSIVI